MKLVSYQLKEAILYGVVDEKADGVIPVEGQMAVRYPSICALLEAEATEIAKDLGLGIEIEPVGHFDPVTFDAGLAQSLRDAARRLGYSHMDIVSGAGHDAETSPVSGLT